MALTGVAKRKVKKVQGKLKKASKAHANQSKILGSLLKNGKKKEKKILKLEQEKSQRVLADAYIRTKTLRTRLVLNLLRRRMPEQLLPRLRKSISRLRERYKFLQSVSKEQK